jgi:hypothetical protein
LDPGNYILQANSELVGFGSNFFDNSAIDFDFQISSMSAAVPEPSSFLFFGLIATGLIFGCTWKKRQRKLSHRLGQLTGNRVGAGGYP